MVGDRAELAPLAAAGRARLPDARARLAGRRRAGLAVRRAARLPAAHRHVPVPLVPGARDPALDPGGPGRAERLAAPAAGARRGRSGADDRARAPRTRSRWRRTASARRATRTSSSPTSSARSTRSRPTRGPAACSRPPTAGYMLPYKTGREVYVGALSWTPDWERARGGDARAVRDGPPPAAARALVRRERRALPLRRLPAGPARPPVRAAPAARGGAPLRLRDRLRAAPPRRHRRPCRGEVRPPLRRSRAPVRHHPPRRDPAQRRGADAGRPRRASPTARCPTRTSGGSTRPASPTCSPGLWELFGPSLLVWRLVRVLCDATVAVLAYAARAAGRSLAAAGARKLAGGGARHGATRAGRIRSRSRSCSRSLRCSCSSAGRSWRARWPEWPPRGGSSSPPISCLGIVLAYARQAARASSGRRALPGGGRRRGAPALRPGGGRRRPRRLVGPARALPDRGLRRVPVAAVPARLRRAR